MEMSLNRISHLLRENGLSAIAYPLNMPEKQQTLLIPLEFERRQYLLELRQDGEQRSWQISEQEELPYCVTLGS
jgi:hypothetical protein